MTLWTNEFSLLTQLYTRADRPGQRCDEPIKFLCQDGSKKEDYRFNNIVFGTHTKQNKNKTETTEKKQAYSQLKQKNQLKTKFNQSKQDKLIEKNKRKDN